MWLKNQLKNRQIWLLLFLLVFLTRAYKLGWGLPFPFHPDERNMALAVMKLKCFSWKGCLKPDFFAYGQLSLYFAYLLAKLVNFLKGYSREISFVQATLALRVFSLLASFLTTFYLYKLGRKFLKDKASPLWLIFLSSFAPFFIQFSHFGTTESFLMFVFTALVFYSLELLEGKFRKELVFKIGFLLGLGIAAKVSALFFIAVPFFALFLKKDLRLAEKLSTLFLIFSQAIVVSFIFSPYNFLAFQDLFHSLSYETAVASGKIKVFYTKQFEGSLPVVFQILNIFPYSLGIVPTFLLLASFFVLKNERKEIFLKLSFLFYFFSQAFLYAKWTRFIAPVFPLGFFLSFLALEKLKKKKVVYYIFVLLIILQGLSFFRVYVREDPRFEASKWMLGNIPFNSVILTETANVVDLPVVRKPFFYRPYSEYYSFNFYEVDRDKNLQAQLKRILSEADYIIVPSRRVFMNFTCEYPSKASFLEKLLHRVYLLGFKPGICEYRKKSYPILNEYYKKLFDGSLGFELVAEFKSYPKFLFFELPDEAAEETFSVFDHPVIRIYKKIPITKHQ